MKDCQRSCLPKIVNEGLEWPKPRLYHLLQVPIIFVNAFSHILQPNVLVIAGPFCTANQLRDSWVCLRHHTHAQGTPTDCQHGFLNWTSPQWSKLLSTFGSCFFGNKNPAYMPQSSDTFFNCQQPWKLWWRSCRFSFNSRSGRTGQVRAIWPLVCQFSDQSLVFVHGWKLIQDSNEPLPLKLFDSQFHIHLEDGYMSNIISLLFCWFQLGMIFLRDLWIDRSKSRHGSGAYSKAESLNASHNHGQSYQASMTFGNILVTNAVWPHAHGN